MWNFVKQTFLCGSVLLALFSVFFFQMRFFEKFFGGKFFSVMAIWIPSILFIILHLVLIAYFYLSDKYYLFALPASHLILTVLFITVLTNVINKMYSDGPAMFVYITGYFYLLPISVITLIITIILRVRK